MQSEASFIAKLDRYYRVGQVLLQSGEGITKCGSHYKVKQHKINERNRGEQ